MVGPRERIENVVGEEARVYAKSEARVKPGEGELAYGEEDEGHAQAAEQDTEVDHHNSWELQLLDRRLRHCVYVGE